MTTVRERPVTTGHIRYAILAVIYHVPVHLTDAALKVPGWVRFLSLLEMPASLYSTSPRLNDKMALE